MHNVLSHIAYFGRKIAGYVKKIYEPDIGALKVVESKKEVFKWKVYSPSRHYQNSDCRMSFHYLSNLDLKDLESKPIALRKVYDPDSNYDILEERVKKLTN